MPTYLPDDLGSYKPDNYTVKLATGAAVNLKYIAAYADTKNKVKVPLCFSAAGLKERDFFNFKINLSSSSKLFEYFGGVCVTKIPDVDVAKANNLNPCEILNGYNEMFTVELEQPIKYAAIGENATFTAYLTAVSKVDVELVFSSDTGYREKRFVSVGSDKTEITEFKIGSGYGGDYKVNLTARAAVNKRFCDYPFCRREIEGRLLVERDFAQSGWNFFVSPRFSNVYAKTGREFILKLENFEVEKEFKVAVNLPDGLEAEKTEIKGTLKKGESKIYKVKISPKTTEPQAYNIDFTATDGQTSILKTVVLSVGEAVSDGIRIGYIGAENESEISLLLVNPEGEVDVDLAGQISTNTPRKKQSDKQHDKPTNNTDIYLIIAAVSLIIVLLAVFSYKKAKVISNGELE